MDKVNFALRRYQQLVPKAEAYIGSFATIERLRVWLVDDVCPLVEQLVRRPSFRDHAMWVLINLAPDACTRERLEIKTLNEALIRVARALARLASMKRIRDQLAFLYPPKLRIVAET